MGVIETIREQWTPDGRRILTSQETTPAGTVTYTEEFDKDGNLIKRDVEHSIEVSLSSKSGTNL